MGASLFHMLNLAMVSSSCFQYELLLLAAAGKALDVAHKSLNVWEAAKY